MPFQVGQAYRNRKFEFGVLDVREKRLLVQLSDGSIHDWDREIQEQIQQNMAYEARRQRALREVGAYESHCWRCSSYILGSELQQCRRCRWYECRQCRACGCGFPLRWSYARVDFS
jgi:hypothetical protein